MSDVLYFNLVANFWIFYGVHWWASDLHGGDVDQHQIVVKVQQLSLAMGNLPFDLKKYQSHIFRLFGL